MTLQFQSMTSAGMFGDTCETSIMDLRQLCPDDVLRYIPRYLVRYEDDTNMPILLDDNYEITTSIDDCDPSIAQRELLECTVILPNQRLVAIGFENVLYTQLMKRFCKAKSLFKYPTLFRRDGSFDPGQPLSAPFIEFLLAELRGPLMKHLRSEAWNGSQATRHSFDGILTQLTNGPTSAGDGCDLYTPVLLNWATLTGGTPGTPVNPSAVIAAAQDAQTIHGVTFNGLSGLNFVQFLRLWLERLIEFDFAAWEGTEIEFELWVGRGQTSCIAEQAACMQPCDGCVNPMSDPQIRDRAAQFRRDKVIYLYPYDDIRITLRQSPALNNQAIFVPKMVGGRPMVAWTFRDQQEQMAIMNGELPFYGSDPGLPSPNALYPPDEVMDMDPVNLFEQRAFTLNLQKNGNCVDVWINAETSMVLMGFHTWMWFADIDCAGLIPEECVFDMSVAVTVCAAVGGEAQQLDLTVAGLESGSAGAVAAGDTYLVNFTDGVTQLLGTVVSYNTGTDVLRLSFDIAVSCTTGGAPASVTLWSDNND